MHLNPFMHLKIQFKQWKMEISPRSISQDSDEKIQKGAKYLYLNNRMMITYNSSVMKVFHDAESIYAFKNAI
jgi:hypothetical protein